MPTPKSLPGLRGRMDAGSGKEGDGLWRRWNSRSLWYLAASCLLLFVLLTAYGYYAFPSQGMANAELGIGGAAVLFFVGFFVFLINEHVKSKQRAGVEVRF